MFQYASTIVACVLIGLCGCKTPAAESAADFGNVSNADLMMKIAEIRDGGVTDASSPDASSPDASSPDASSPDASSPDAASPDASSPDAASPDASSGPDGGAVDAGGIRSANCVHSCAAPADCSTSSAAFDADNYNCTAGACEYKGCNSDTECQSSFSSSLYICRRISGSLISLCVHSCAVPADCSTSSAAFDADNYNCTAGACEYKGCNSDTECQSSFSSSLYICRGISGSSIPLCVHSCTMPTDCSTSSAASDADNYNCTAGACEYKGCNSDTECQSTYSSSLYICR